MISRRNFLTRSSILLGASFAPSVIAIQPFDRKSPRFMLALAAYSFRKYFKEAPQEKDSKVESVRQITLFDFIDYCSEHKVQGAELTSYYFPKTVTQEFLLKLKRHAFLQGVDISGTAVGNNLTLPSGEKRNEQLELVKAWVRHAQVMGAPHIRIFAGAVQGITREEGMQNCITALKELCAFAGQHGVILGLENHGGIVAEADDLLRIIKEVESPWLAINLDTGNFQTSDPYGDLAKCAPFAANVQFKVEIRPRNGQKEKADFPRLFKIMEEAKYRGYIALEYESAEDPYAAVPGLLEQMRRFIV
ncbi:MAG: sugar phosphate isomerase/epimerase family protein [Verrucomicrobiota bacterium]|nr:sugar phosphate isomerase/epimerase family protein [Verrucomicrobiota bacterium]